MNPAQEQTATTAILDGRYQLLDRVGEGAMAEVYRADDLLLGRTVAVKIMRSGADVLGSPERARTEMNVLASLDHPSLVTLYDGKIVPGQQPYLVMEFVDGITLAQRLHEGAMAPVDAARLASDLAAALEAVHAAGIVHRDVKPSNVLLSPSVHDAAGAEAKLTDFGVACLIDGTRITSPGTVVGTAAYLAPEQLRGEAPSPAADIYALGLLLLEALTGERAFPDATGIAAVMARLLNPPDVPDRLGAEWGQLLRRMTASDAETRPTAAEVGRIVAGFPTETQPLTLPAPLPVAHRRPPSRGRRRRIATAAIGAAAAAMALSGAVWLGSTLPRTADNPSSGTRVVVLPEPGATQGTGADSTGDSTQNGSSNTTQRGPAPAVDPVTTTTGGAGRGSAQTKGTSGHQPNEHASDRGKKNGGGPGEKAPKKPKQKGKAGG